MPTKTDLYIIIIIVDINLKTDFLYT